MEDVEKLKELKTLTMVVYALQGAGFILGGLTWIVAVVINYIKKEELAGTWLESHCRWQIRTFWFGLLWGVIGGILRWCWSASSFSSPTRSGSSTAS